MPSFILILIQAVMRLTTWETEAYLCRVPQDVCVCVVFLVTLVILEGFWKRNALNQNGLSKALMPQFQNGTQKRLCKYIGKNGTQIETQTQ